MNDQFATAMGRALEQTRAGNPAGATATIQAALGGAAPQPWPRVRRPLGQTIDSLFNGKRVARSFGQAPVRAPEVPTGASWETRHHAGAHGARDYRLFVPSPRAEPVQGLVMMLHGCTQTAEDFASGTRMNLLAERHNLVVVYPEQTRTANQMACWNWFRSEDQTRAGGEPALLAEMAGQIAAELNVPGGRIFATGLSAGGAMAAILGRVFPEVFAAVGVHSGLAPGSASDVAGAFAAMQGQPTPAGTLAEIPARTIVFHGLSDTTVAPANGDAVMASALGRAASIQSDAPHDGAQVTVHRDPSGRLLAEHWTIPGLGHAWSGGSAEGSHTAPSGPDASAEMVRFFLSLDPEERA